MSTYFGQLYSFIIRSVALSEIPFNLPFIMDVEEGFWERRKYLAPFPPRRGVCAAILMCSLSAGCITDATVDLTKAPFDASTELTDATTGAITKMTDGTRKATTDLTEPTREFLSSTTPGAWFHSDGGLNPGYEKIAFVVVNFDNLQEDMAQGGGEYLVSLSKLMGVPQNSRESFMKSAQHQYGYIFEEGRSRPEALRRLIQTIRIQSVSS